MKNISGQTIATLLAALLLASCTSMEEIERLCSNHPVRLPEAPILTDGFFVSRYWVSQPEQLWAADMLLKRGFQFVETNVAGGVAHYTVSRDSNECAAAQAALGVLDAQVRTPIELKMAELGLKPGECIARKRQAAPSARYRIELVNHSPPRHNWIDGLSGRQDVRTEARFKDTETNTILADIRSFTVAYQVTVSGASAQGCNRRSDVLRLMSDFIQPAAKPEARVSAVERTAPVESFPASRPVPLELVESTQPGGSINWKQKKALGEVKTKPIAQVSLAGTQKGWELRMPGTEGLRIIPLPWIGEAHRKGAYVDQPAWIYPTPRGIGLLLVWRKAEKVDRSVRLTWVEFSTEGKPLLRMDAPLPMDAGINPFDVLFTLPAVGSDAITFTATELERPDDGNNNGMNVRRVSSYRWPLTR